MSEIKYKEGPIFIDDDGYVGFRIRVLGSLEPHIFMTLHSVGWQAFTDINDAADPFWTGTHVFPTDADIEDIVATYVERTR